MGFGIENLVDLVSLEWYTGFFEGSSSERDILGNDEMAGNHDEIEKRLWGTADESSGEQRDFCE